MFARSMRAMSDASFLAARERSLIEDLEILPSWQERLEEILRRDRKRPGLDGPEKSDAHRVPGCLSKVWLVCGVNAEGRGVFRSDAESPAVRALVAAICELYHDAPLAECASHEPTFLEALGIERHLTGTRREALVKLRDAIRSFTKSHLPK